MARFIGDSMVQLPEPKGAAGCQHMKHSMPLLFGHVFDTADGLLEKDRDRSHARTLASELLQCEQEAFFSRHLGRAWSATDGSVPFLNQRMATNACWPFWQKLQAGLRAFADVGGMEPLASRMRT